MCCAPGGLDLAHNPTWGSVKVTNEKLFCFLFLDNMLTLLESYTEKILSQYDL